MRNALSFAHAGKNIDRGAQKIAEGRVLKGAGQIAAGFALSLSAAVMAPITLPLKAAMAARSHLKTAGAKFQSALKQCHGNIDTKLPWLKTMGPKMDAKIADSMQTRIDSLAAKFPTSKTLLDLSLRFGQANSNPLAYDEHGHFHPSDYSDTWG
jgi:hypothetical protein